MAKLELFQPNAGLEATNYYENYSIDQTASGWFQATSEGLIYSQLSGKGITYNSYNDPLLGLITSARSINESGDTNWKISGLNIAASDTSDLSYAMRTGSAFTDDMVDTILSGDDTIIGSSGNDEIIYSSGKDSIDGKEGVDTINFYEYSYKGNFDSSLIVNLATKQYKVTTDANVVITSTIYNIENIEGSNSDDRITGNDFANSINGNDGDDIIYGGGGNDILNGGSNYYYDADQLYGESGNDLLISSTGNTYIDGGTGNDTVSYFGMDRSVYIDLSNEIGKHGYYNSYYNTWDRQDTLIGIENVVGTSWNDTILGDSNSNSISGGAGNDTMNGLAGVDTLDYLTRGYNGVVVDLISSKATGQGTDTIYNFENVKGSNHNDVILGNNGNNVFYGNAGDDILNGRKGVDTLVGGKGKDVFVFDTTLSASTNKDTINDFSAVDDTVRLDKTIFSKLTVVGALNSSYFKATSTGKPTDSNDYILYNTSTGALSYDADGSGSAASAIQFATLKNAPSVTAADFVVVA